MAELFIGLMSGTSVDSIDSALVNFDNDTLELLESSSSSIEKTFREKNHSKKELAEKIGTEIAKRSIKNGVKEVAFDKGKYKYHGLIKILAEAAREGGLNF